MYICSSPISMANVFTAEVASAMYLQTCMCHNVHVYICIHIHVYTYMYTDTFVCRHVYMYVSSCICILQDKDDRWPEGSLRRGELDYCH